MPISVSFSFSFSKMTDWEACPRCHSTKHTTPNMRLLVNVCGHNLCDRCVEQLFFRGSGACPTCGKPLKRANFRAQLFEDAFIDKETHIRRSILKEFNLHEEDFATLKEYNDYLELTEEFIFNLANNIALEATNEKLKAARENYKQKHLKNKNVKSKAQQYLEQVLVDERHAKEQQDKFLEFERNTQADRNEKRRRGEEMLDTLAGTELPAETIVQEFAAQEQLKQEQLQKDAKVHNQITSKDQAVKFATSAELQYGEPYIYAPQVDADSSCGPSAPDWHELFASSYLQHIRPNNPKEAAGGFGIEWSCKRALMEAMDGLYIDHEELEPS